MVKKPIFDTSVYSDYTAEIEEIYTSALFPTIVLYELIATSIDDSTLQRYNRWRITLNKINAIINPTKTDWWETSKAIRRLYITKAAAQSKLKTLRNDALIARLAVIHEGFVVTHDIDDFQIIQKAMPKLDGNVDGADAAAGLNSSVADLTKWIRLQLGKGEFEGKRIFSEKNSWEMWQPAVILPISEAASKANPTRHFNAYGLGWNLFDYQGKKIVTHSGGLDGMLSRTVLIPETNIGFVVLSNSEYPAYSIMYQKMLDVFTDAPVRDYNAETLKRTADAKVKEDADAKKMEDARVKNTKPSLNLKDYLGTFTGELYGDATISEENGKLVLRMLPSPNFVADLEHWHYDTFRIKWRPSVAYNFPAGFVTFNIDKDGKSAQFSIDQPNSDFWFYELEFKRKGK